MRLQLSLIFAVLAAPIASAYDQVLYCPDAQNPVGKALASIQRTGTDHFVVAGGASWWDGPWKTFSFACRAACWIQVEFNPNQMFLTR